MTDETIEAEMVMPAEGAGSTPDWVTALDPDLAALAVAKGWREPGEALRSYAHLERRIGGEKIALPAPDAPAEDWHEVWSRLGRPASPADYGLAPPPEGAAYDAAAADWFRGVAHAIGLSDRQAQQLHDAFLDRVAATTQAAQAETDGEANVDGDASGAGIEAQLRALWGRDYPARAADLRRAIAAVLPEDEAVFALAEAVGEVPLLQLLAKVGAAFGEDSLVGGTGAGGDPQAEIRRIQAAAQENPRHPYLDRSHPEHAATVRRMAALFERAQAGPPTGGA